jgi:hypothetical protein
VLEEGVDDCGLEPVGDELALEVCTGVLGSSCELVIGPDALPPQPTSETRRVMKAANNELR